MAASRSGETREERSAHAARGRADREKKLSAGICIEYSLTFLARLPSAANRQAAPRRSCLPQPPCTIVLIYAL